MTSKWIVRVALITVVLISSSAHATTLGVLGNGSLLNASFNPAVSVPGLTATTSPNLAWGGGVYAQSALLPAVTLELGLYYTMRNFTMTSATVTTDNFTYLEIPLVVRLWLLPILNVGAGGYYAASLGDVSINGTTTTYAAGNFNSGDYGALFTVGAKLPIGPVGIVANVNYLLGMKDLNNGLGSGVITSSLKWSGFEFQAGVSLDI